MDNNQWRRFRGIPIALALLLIFGCSPNPPAATPSDAAPGTTTPAPATDAPATQEARTLVVATSQAPWNPAYAEVIKAYEAATGNRVDLRAFPNADVKTQQVNDIQGGQHVFDVFQINEQDMVQFMSNAWVQPFTDIDPSAALDDAVFTYDGLPYWDSERRVFGDGGALTSIPINGNLLIFMYRKDLYEQLGLQVPTTWDQVVSNAEAMKQGGSVAYGGTFMTKAASGGTAQLAWAFQPLLAAYGGRWFADEGTDWTPTANSPEAIEAATMLRRLATLGPEATSTIGQAEAIASLSSGEAGSTYLVAAAASAIENPTDSAVAGKIGYAPLPLNPQGQPASTSGIWSLAVPAGIDKERSEAALEFIQFVTSQESQTLFASLGGIPVRSDYDAAGVPAQLREAYAALGPSAEGAVGQFRYTFAPEFLTFAEPILAEIVAGATSPEDGMNRLQTELGSLIESLGLPTGG